MSLDFKCPQICLNFTLLTTKIQIQKGFQTWVLKGEVFHGLKPKAKPLANQIGTDTRITKTPKHDSFDLILLTSPSSFKKIYRALYTRKLGKMVYPLRHFNQHLVINVMGQSRTETARPSMRLCIYDFDQHGKWADEIKQLPSQYLIYISIDLIYLWQWC